MPDPIASQDSAVLLERLLHLQWGMAYAICSPENVAEYDAIKAELLRRLDLAIC